MTLAEAGEIFRYWEENPPAHLVLQIIARLLGWTPRSGTPPVDDIAAAAPPGLAVIRGGDIGMPPPHDRAALQAANRARAMARARRGA